VNIRLYIDYDNIGLKFKRAGLRSLATQALLSTAVPTSKTVGRCDVRVYGGWYEGSSLTPLAQQVIAELGVDFPSVLPFTNKAGETGKVMASAELACSLEAEPTHHLFNTFRQKSPPNSLACVNPASKGCVEKDCPLSCIPTWFDTEQCPKSGCDIRLHDILFRREQKLVDTMLTCDIIHAARLKCDFSILVSSDDDLLPAIRISLLEGTPFARLHPKTYHQLAAFPSGGAYFVELTL
jgi:hypothetical protein